MSTHIQHSFSCDKCGKKLPTFANHVNIVTELGNEDSCVWERIKVRFEYNHGIHNDATNEEADLCQKCAIDLLQDALKRVSKGERASKGYETSRMLKFNEPF